MSDIASTSGTKTPHGDEILGEIEVVNAIGYVDPDNEDEGSDTNEMDEDDTPEFEFEDRSVVSEVFSSEPELDPGEDSDEEDLEYAPHVKPTYFGTINPLQSEPCSCRSPLDLESSISLLSLMETLDVNFDNHTCLIDNVIRAYNFVYGTTSTSANRFRLAFADLFYRVRHENLFKLLCKSFNLPAEHSDKSFRLFGIDSDRTPDLIVEKDGVIYIIEVAVTSKMEKAAQLKGSADGEFESKYMKEIMMFDDKNIPSRYLPVFFDMTNTDHTYTKEQFNSINQVFPVNKAMKALLDQMAKSFSVLTNNFKVNLILPSSIIFSTVLKVTPCHDGISFLYNKSRLPIKQNLYKEMIISPYVYSKFSNEKTHLFWLLDNTSIKDGQKAIFVVSGNSHRISLQVSKYGTDINTLREILINCDYGKLFDFVNIKIGDNLISSTDNEQGVKIFERATIKPTPTFDAIPVISSHSTRDFKDGFDLNRYRKIINDYVSDNYHSIHYDANYEDKVIDSILNFDFENKNGGGFDMLPKGLLGNLKTSNTDIRSVFEEIKPGYIEQNSSNYNLPIRRLKMKQPFLLPIADLNESSYCKLEYKNQAYIGNLADNFRDNNPYTSQILDNTLRPNYCMYTKVNPASKPLLDLEAEKFRVSNEINKLQKQLLRTGSQDHESRLSKTNDIRYTEPFTILKKKYNELNKEIRLKKKGEGVQQNISYLKLPTKNKGSNLRRLYDREMSHFKDKSKQSTIEGVGIINNIEDDYSKDIKIFSAICNMLSDNRGMNPNQILDKHVTEDARLVKDLKKQTMENYKSIIEQAQNSCLGHAAALVSRFAHSLMFYSQLPFSSDYVRVDNLGYKNVLLIVRGGKKIFKSKSSKLYRLIYPISEELLPWYTTGHQDKGSFQYTQIDGVNYALTPWSMLHESILTDSISFYHRIISFTVLNLNPRLSLKQQFKKVSVNVLLSFHNRRQTEVVLANLRYILLSTLGDFTGVEQILNEFFGFNYDRFQSFIRNSIFLNYPVYFTTLQNLKDVKTHTQVNDINLSDFVNSRLKNIFTNEVITTVEELALMIYSTFLMTKAPYQKLVERANNVKGILEIHELFNKDIGLDLCPEEQLRQTSELNSGNLSDYANRLFSSDFSFDPKFCALVGGFVDNIFRNNNEQDDIESNWIKILNQPWDEMATSTGLRGDYNEVEDFWGQKGYFVIYKRLLNQPGYPDKLMKIISGDFTDNEKRRILRSLNEVFMDKIENYGEFLIFHAVDKVQWRGGREIYVMDIHTKAVQQPIEKFMAVLCKKLDNELISIPSDRRAQVIHHSIFEKDIPVRGNSTWFLTLDCSKWAPKSIFIKFVITILNMSTIPNSFKTHFMNYIDKLYSKRIYFNKGEIEVLEKNPQHADKVAKYLTKDEKVGGYYLEMPYSWVMGIFNYTSSFLHAANQKYFSYILTKSTMLSYKEETSIVMFAHSDDSGGRLSASTSFMAQRALVLYEIFLKSCNHLLSKKKSVVSRIYFEILSVIYLFKKLLALLPKFLGGIRFLPTDKGPAQDLMQSYSKSIEIMVAGGDFSIAYLVLKIYSHLVWKFYMNRDPTSSDYDRPVQYMGMPDAHPLFILLCGSDADILRLIRNGKDLSKLVSFVNTMSKTMDGDGPIKPLKFEIKVKGIKRGFEDHLELFSNGIDNWSIRNVNFHNSALNALSFLRKLNDSGFVGSLVNESTTRRISRAFFLRFGDASITRMGNVKLSLIVDSLNLCQSYNSDGTGYIKHIFEGVLGIDEQCKITEEFKRNSVGTERMINLLGETLKSPLRIYKYLDMVTLEGRKIVNVSRTLKPTLLQLVKSSKVFSNFFDPASLVSYIKEPMWNWALNDIRGLSTASGEVSRFLQRMGYNIDEVEPDLLLRVCRTYGRENTKSIYLYSRVPGEVRQIKTYSAFLTFLSVNSFYNKEIQGLTLKMSDNENNKEYLEPQLHEEVYFINDAIAVLMVLIDKCGIELVNELNLMEILEIGWQGGGVNNFLDFMESLFDTDVRYNTLKGQFNNLRIKLGKCTREAQPYVGSVFYTFLSSQKMRGGWYGRGEIYIQIENKFYSFPILNNEIEGLYTNSVGKLPMHHSEILQDIMSLVNISLRNMKRPKVLDYRKQHFGYDSSGDLSVFSGREIEKGVIATILDKRGYFVDNLLNFEVDRIEKDWITVRRGDGDDKRSYKLNFIPVRKSELIPIMKLLLNPKDFEYKLLEVGLNDFEDFLYTEILTEFGKNIVTDFDSFADNYQSSMLYQIFQDIYNKGYSKINRKMEFNTLPASEGSLLRILIDYSGHNNAGILKVPRNLNPLIMQMRSELSNKVVALIGENALDYYNQIYSGVEKKEISDHYDNISKCENLNIMRDSVIKLMTYWGYGSLVNSIETFSLKREISNYLYFNVKNCHSMANILSEKFVLLVIGLKELFGKWRVMYNQIDLIVPSLKRFIDPDNFVNDYIRETVMATYKENPTLGLWYSIYPYIFATMLISHMQDEDFVSELQALVGSIHILSSLPVSWNCRYDLLSVINVLRSCWIKCNVTPYDLNFIQKNQAMPDHIPNFKAKLKIFGVSIPPARSYYHGFLDDDFLSYIYSRGEIKIGEICYRTSIKVVNKSKVSVNMVPFMKHLAPLREEVLDNENYQMADEEYDFSPIDDVTIIELLSEIPKPLYKPSTVRKQKFKTKTNILATVHWIVNPFTANDRDHSRYYRQVGENIIVLTDTYIGEFIKCFPNSGVRIVDLSKILKKKVPVFFAFYSLHKELCKREYLDQMIGGVDYYINEVDKSLVKCNHVRSVKGDLCEIVDAGLGMQEIALEMSKGKELIEDDGCIKFVDKREIEVIQESKKYPEGYVEEIIDPKIAKYNAVNKAIAELESKNFLDKKSINRIRDKHIKNSINEGVSTQVILGSIAMESDLIAINQGIISGETEISAENQKKMHLSPDYFGAARAIDLKDKDPINDKKVRSEINSLHSELSSLIGSNTLNLSKGFKKVVEATYKMWVKIYKGSKYKRENKGFLITLFNSLCSNSLVSDSEQDDQVWQEINNKFTVYIAQDDEDDEDDEEFSNIFSGKIGARLRYRAEGT